MWDSDHDNAAAMAANALIRSEGSRDSARIAAELRSEHPKGDHRAFWGKVRDLLKSGKQIPPYFAHLDEIPNPNAVRYVRVQCFASGGAVSGHSKASKEQANYSPFGDEERHCSICSMWREPNRCTEVQGDISRTAICDYFERKK
jgi:hypothetical protein